MTGVDPLAGTDALATAVTADGSAIVTDPIVDTSLDTGVDAGLVADAGSLANAYMDAATGLIIDSVTG